MDTGDHGFLDVQNDRFQGAKRLLGELTLRDGKVVWDLNGCAVAPWKE